MWGAADPWSWQPHPEVWLLVVGMVVLGGYAVRVIGPKVVAADEPIVTRRQQGSFVAAVVLLWVAADWPIHDIGEENLYSVHMVQHLLMAFVVPPLLLMATPTWLARLVLGESGWPARLLRQLARPIPAAVAFNAVQILLHWEAVVRLSAENGLFHYGMHVLLFSTALLMWMPVVSPLPEMRISLPFQMVYLFLQSVIPTVPGGWLTFAENPVYPVYDHGEQLWGFSVIDDQQAAGAIMKILGGFYLWAIITVLFFRWAAKHEALAERERPRILVPSTGELEGELTYETVAERFERAGPAPPEPPPRDRSGPDPGG